MFEEYSEVTMSQAYELAQSLGKSRSMSYLLRSASTGKFPARKKQLGNMSFWMVRRKPFIAWLNTPRKPGPAKGSKHKKQELVEA
jgi:hypothetical protein